MAIYLCDQEESFLEKAFYFVSATGSISKAQDLDDRGMKQGLLT